LFVKNDLLVDINYKTFFLLEFLQGSSILFVCYCCFLVDKENNVVFVPKPNRLI